MKKVLLYITLVSLMACDKKDLELPSESPVFEAVLKVNGEETSFYAGVEEYYMFSSIIRDDSTNIYRSVLLKENEDDVNKSGFGLDFYVNNPEDLKEALERNGLIFKENVGVSGFINRLTTIASTEVSFQAAWQVNDVQHQTDIPLEVHQTSDDTLHLNYFLENNGLVHFNQILRPVLRGHYSVWIDIEKTNDGYIIEAKSNANHFNVIWSDGAVSTKKNISPNRQYTARMNSLALGSVNLVINIPESIPNGVSTFGFLNENSHASAPPPMLIPVDILYRNSSGKSF